MNNIITLGEFVEILKKTDFFKEQSDCEAIVSAFFQSITDALKTDDTVSIKGFGDFAVVSRESGLVLFTPDPAMADTINEPFAFFEPIELADIITDEMLDKAADETPAGDKTETTEVEPTEPVVTETPVEKAPEPVIPVIEAEQKPELPIVDAEINDEKPIEVEPETKAEDNVTVNTEEQAANEKETDNETVAKKVVEDVVEESATEDNEDNETEEEDDNGEEEYEYTPARRGHSTFALVAYTLLGIAIGFVIGLFTAEYIFADDEDDADYTEQMELLDDTSFSPEETEALQNSIDSALNDNTPVETEASPQSIQTNAPEAVTAVITDTVRPNHYLTHMSRRFYGGATEFWVYIYLENQDKLGHPDRLRPNTVVVIPPAEKYGIDPNSQKSRDAAKQKVSEIYSKFK